jgi:hypothetical protein
MDLLKSPLVFFKSPPIVIMYIFTLVYVYMCIYMYIHTSIYTCIHISIQICLHTYLHTLIHTYMYTYIHIHIHISWITKASLWRQLFKGSVWWCNFAMALILSSTRRLQWKPQRYKCLWDPQHLNQHVILMTGLLD